jgi:hypothetical protein
MPISTIDQTGLNAPLTLTSPTLSSPVTSGTPTGVGVLTSGTAVASTSGTSIDFTGIPSWVKRITVMFQGVSTNGTSIVQVQVGAGSVTTTGYISTGVYTGGSGAATANSTAGFIFNDDNLAAGTRSGIMTIATLGSNIWVMSAVHKAGTATAGYSAGDVTLSGTLDRVRVTTVNGTDTFDAGSVNILYE